ncbi:hypothetical protein PTSG_12287 [Salpingoeca rosetta]|uniref:PUB domain-containing protein n=1 Tax=Salpingoeca rosetta (strain ATCC 50818 / BSB-021) TaxID=946362 RepID=F2U9Z6_SALR5|nr:uncharacterized protein PTSG_12287 [Salpingoeca rosetta]EGD73571.1 hypothetical protein PTSG_12287 [Salpingoeca rosetta]|eukprot:XP_004993853.1 hypothetical protein PTSG_12287 [Salpingoeca rosetta]
MDLFRRFKKDRKFKRAGEGHRLGVEGASQGQPASASSSSSSASTARNASASGRQQPREMSQAARAAQERMQRAQQTGRPNTSSAIKSEARRQVQAEAASSGTQPSTATPSRDQPAGQWKQEADRLQVQVVCPITGNLVRERDKTDHLRRELTQRLTEMPVPMAAKMVWTLNSREKRELAVKTICAYINNVLQHPDEPKYRRINKENKAFQARILGAEGALEFLKAVGFEEENGEEDGKTFLALPEGVSTDELTTAKDVISSDQTIICRLHRDVRVLKPPRGAAIAAAMRVDLPSDFYKLTVDDLRFTTKSLGIDSHFKGVI